MTSGQLFSRLLKYSLRYWKGFAVAVLAMLVTAATETAFPALMKPLLDKGFRPDTEFNVWLVPIGVLLIFIVRGLSSFVMGYTMQWVSNSVLRDLRQAMFSRLISMPVASFDSASSGSLIAKVISESQFVMFAFESSKCHNPPNLIVVLWLGFVTSLALSEDMLGDTLTCPKNFHFFRDSL